MKIIAVMSYRFSPKKPCVIQMCDVIPYKRWSRDNRNLMLLLYHGDKVLIVSIFQIWVIQIPNLFKIKCKLMVHL